MCELVDVEGFEQRGETIGSEQGGGCQARGMEDRAELELGDLVHQVHVVHVIQRVRRPNLARPGGGGSAAPLIRGRVPQVVEVAVGDAGQAFEPAVAKAMVGARTELARGRPGQGAVEPVELTAYEKGKLGARQPGDEGARSSRSVWSVTIILR